MGIYQGMEGDFLGVPLSHLVEETDVPVASLPEAVQSRLSEGISVESEDKARTTVEDYRRQIQEAADQAKETADTLKSSGDQGGAAS